MRVARYRVRTVGAPVHDWSRGRSSSRATGSDDDVPVLVAGHLPMTGSRAPAQPATAPALHFAVRDGPVSCAAVFGGYPERLPGPRSHGALSPSTSARSCNEAVAVPTPIHEARPRMRLVEYLACLRAGVRVPAREARAGTLERAGSDELATCPMRGLSVRAYCVRGPSGSLGGRRPRRAATHRHLPGGPTLAPTETRGTVLMDGVGAIVVPARAASQRPRRPHRVLTRSSKAALGRTSAVKSAVAGRADVLDLLNAHDPASPVGDSVAAAPRRSRKVRPGPAASRKVRGAAAREEGSPLRAGARTTPRSGGARVEAAVRVAGARPAIDPARPYFSERAGVRRFSARREGTRSASARNAGLSRGAVPLVVIDRGREWAARNAEPGRRARAAARDRIEPACPAAPRSRGCASSPF
jgi:hypothetical protein